MQDLKSFRKSALLSFAFAGLTSQLLASVHEPDYKVFCEGETSEMKLSRLTGNPIQYHYISVEGTQVKGSAIFKRTDFPTNTGGKVLYRFAEDRNSLDMDEVLFRINSRYDFYEELDSTYLVYYRGDQVESMKCY